MSDYSTKKIWNLLFIICVLLIRFLLSEVICDFNQGSLCRGWIQGRDGSDDDFDWAVKSGLIDGIANGQGVPIDPDTIWDYSLFLESRGHVLIKKALVYSPVLVPSGSYVSLIFWYHITGTGGTLHFHIRRYAPQEKTNDTSGFVTERLWSSKPGPHPNWDIVQEDFEVNGPFEIVLEGIIGNTSADITVDNITLIGVDKMRESTGAVNTVLTTRTNTIPIISTQPSATTASTDAPTTISTTTTRPIQKIRSEFTFKTTTEILLGTVVVIATRPPTLATTTPKTPTTTTVVPSTTREPELEFVPLITPKDEWIPQQSTRTPLTITTSRVTTTTKPWKETKHPTKKVKFSSKWSFTTKLATMTSSITGSSVYQNRSNSFRPTTFEVNPGINVYQMPSSSIYPHLPWIIAAGAAGIFWMGILVLMFCYVRRRQTTSTSARDDLRQSIVHHNDIPDLKMEVLYENATYTNTLNSHQRQCPEIAEFENNYQYIS